MSKRIGVLTGGGDCPGLNAVIRAVVKTAIVKYSCEVIGFEDGFAGLVENRYVPLDYERASGILATGGTILGTSNKANPFQYWRKNAAGVLESRDESGAAAATYVSHRLDALICIGGDGTFTISEKLGHLGLNIIGVPKTIDNDIWGTDRTFGFDTAVATITDALDKIQTTAMSHKRVMVVEVMGRYAGWLALTAGVAGGGDIILLPEIPYNMDTVVRKVQFRAGIGKRFTIVVVAEGARPQGGSVVVDRQVPDSPDPVRLGGIGKVLATQVEDLTGQETRVTVLGHLQRGGTPTATDRVLCTLLGNRAVEMAMASEFGRFVAWRNGGLVTEALNVPAGRQRLVPLDHPLIAAARAVGTIFGNETN